eukprot:gene29543-38659_t
MRSKGGRPFPGNPEVRAECSSSRIADMKEVQKVIDKSLVVFISHRWLRSLDNQPDDANDSKFQLIIEGLEKVKKYFCPDMQYMYLWLDYSSIDQDRSSVNEWRLLNQVMRLCDIIFTPVVDDLWESRTYTMGPAGWMMTYPAAWWCDKVLGYLNRSWCRLEMYLAANEPLVASDAHRLDRFLNILRSSLVEKQVRPHVLYGTHEWKTGRPPILLPPFPDYLYQVLDPLSPTAFITKEGDRRIIQDIISRCPRRVVQERYMGDMNSAGQMHGQGRYILATGDVYEGNFVCGIIQGPGKYSYANGNSYHGEFMDGKSHGKGRLTLADGSYYEGDFERGYFHGKGKMIWVGGETFEGCFEDDKQNGKGRFTYPNGKVVKGVWRNGQKVVIEKSSCRIM